MLGAPTARHFVIAASLCLATLSSAMAQNMVSVRGSTLNMRSGPGTNYRVVARAPNGTILRNLGCQGTGNSRWCEVETKDGNVRAWVKGTFLRESGPCQPQAVTRGEVRCQWHTDAANVYADMAVGVEAL